MSSLRIKAAKAASAVSLALLMTAGFVSVAQAAPTHGGVKIAVGDVSVQSCQNVGYGTWCYGTEPGESGLQHCYSNYVHYSNRHSATVNAGSWSDKQVAAPGDVARASVTTGWGYTCYAYWNNQA